MPRGTGDTLACATTQDRHRHGKRTTRHKNILKKIAPPRAHGPRTKARARTIKKNNKKINEKNKGANKRKVIIMNMIIKKISRGPRQSGLGVID